MHATPLWICSLNALFLDISTKAFHSCLVYLRTIRCTFSDNEMHDAFRNNAFGYVTPVDSRHITPFTSNVVIVFIQARVHVISILVLVICRATPLLRLMTDPIKLWPLPGILCSLWMPLDGYAGADATNKKI